MPDVQMIGRMTRRPGTRRVISIVVLLAAAYLVVTLTATAMQPDPCPVAPSSVVGGMGMPGKAGTKGYAFRFGMERNREEGTQDEQ